MLVNGLANLNNIPAIIVTYESGSSGEFLCNALTQTFDIFHKPNAEWIGDWRVGYDDFFGKCLARGDHTIDHELLLKKVNHRLLHSQPTILHIGAVHPRPPAAVDFINLHMPKVPMIKIVCRDTLSKKFRKLACYYKLGSDDKFLKNLLLPREMAWADDLKNPSIEVEWRTLFVDNTRDEFKKIESFIGQPGNFELFSQLVSDYVQRNRQILDECLVDQ
jgi:hypothetical protein